MPLTAIESVAQIKEILNADDGDISTPAIQQAVQRAIRILSKRSPQRLYYEPPNLTGSQQAWNVPAAWQVGFSVLFRVDYPVLGDQGASEDVELRPENYTARQSSATDPLIWQFQVFGFTPAAASRIRFHYTAMQKIGDTAAECTIQDMDDENSFLWLAASFCFKILASRAARVTTGSFSGDTISYQTRSQQYLTLAKEYLAMSGLESFLVSETGGLAMLDWESKTPEATSWLTHG